MHKANVRYTIHLQTTCQEGGMLEHQRMCLACSRAGEPKKVNDATSSAMLYLNATQYLDEI